MRDLALLLGRFVKFRFFVILQAPPKNFEDLRGGFACGANYKNAVELLFVIAIACVESRFDVFACSSNLLLFCARPSGRLRGRGRRRM